MQLSPGALVASLRNHLWKQELALDLSFKLLSLWGRSGLSLGLPGLKKARLSHRSPYQSSCTRDRNDSYKGKESQKVPLQTGSRQECSSYIYWKNSLSQIPGHCPEDPRQVQPGRTNCIWKMVGICAILPPQGMSLSRMYHRREQLTKQCHVADNEEPRNQTDVHMPKASHRPRRMKIAFDVHSWTNFLYMMI